MNKLGSPLSYFYIILSLFVLYVFLDPSFIASNIYDDVIYVYIPIIVTLLIIWAVVWAKGEFKTKKKYETLISQESLAKSKNMACLALSPLLAYFCMYILA